MTEIEKYNKLLELGEDITRLPEAEQADYNSILLSDPYIEYKNKRLSAWADSADLHLISRLYKLERIIDGYDTCHKNYPALIANYGNLIKLTSPLLERMNKNKIEIDAMHKLNSVYLDIKDEEEGNN